MTAFILLIVFGLLAGVFSYLYFGRYWYMRWQRPELYQEWGIKERGEPEPGILADHRDDLTKWPLREGDIVMTRWISEWKKD